MSDLKKELNKDSKYEAKKPGFTYYLVLVSAIVSLVSFQNCSSVDKSIARTHNISK